MANPDHTTLLLNCYTKTSDRARLDAFIKNEAKRDAGADELPFDLDTAIRVCRQAGFFEHATYLARKYGRHEEYLRIQIEDAEEYKDALRYLRSLGPEACQENLVHYGRSLLHHEPEATTDLLIDLCSGNLGKKTTHQDMHTDPRANGSGPAVLSYLGVNRLFGADAQNSGGPATPNGASTDPTTPEAESPLEEEPGYIPPSPRHFFAHFIDHHDLFVHFLEDVAYSLWGQKVDATAQRTSVPIPRREENDSTDPALSDERAVWNTLLELYLDETNSNDASVAATARSKVISLLGSGDSIPFDPMHALVLCSMAGFTDGLVGLWESMGMYEDALRYWMEKAAEAPDATANGNAPDPGSEVFRYLDVYGPTNLSLYPLVLRWMTSSPVVLSKYQDRLPGILATIDEERIIPPLAVVQLLSRNGVASVGLVKDWLRSKVDETKNEIEAVSFQLTFSIREQADGHRTSRSCSRTAPRRQRRSSRSRTSQTRRPPRSSRLRSARRAAASSTCPRCTSCASTATTSAASRTRTRSASSARSSTRWSRRSGGTRRASRTATTSSSTRCTTATTGSPSSPARSAAASSPKTSSTPNPPGKLKFRCRRGRQCRIH